MADFIKAIARLAEEKKKKEAPQMEQLLGDEPTLERLLDQELLLYSDLDVLSAYLSTHPPLAKQMLDTLFLTYSHQLHQQHPHIQAHRSLRDVHFCFKVLSNPSLSIGPALLASHLGRPLLHHLCDYLTTPLPRSPTLDGYFCEVMANLLRLEPQRVTAFLFGPQCGVLGLLVARVDSRSVVVLLADILGTEQDVMVAQKTLLLDIINIYLAQPDLLSCANLDFMLQYMILHRTRSPRLASILRLFFQDGSHVGRMLDVVLSNAHRPFHRKQVCRSINQLLLLRLNKSFQYQVGMGETHKVGMGETHQVGMGGPSMEPFYETIRSRLGCIAGSLSDKSSVLLPLVQMVGHLQNSGVFHDELVEHGLLESVMGVVAESGSNNPLQVACLKFLQKHLQGHLHLSQSHFHRVVLSPVVRAIDQGQQDKRWVYMKLALPLETLPQYRPFIASFPPWSSFLHQHLIPYASRQSVSLGSLPTKQPPSAKTTKASLKSSYVARIRQKLEIKKQEENRKKEEKQYFPATYWKLPSDEEQLEALMADL